jgi:hypothetical protein
VSACCSPVVQLLFENLFTVLSGASFFFDIGLDNAYFLDFYPFKNLFDFGPDTVFPSDFVSFWLTGRV